MKTTSLRKPRTGYTISYNQIMDIIRTKDDPATLYAVYMHLWSKPDGWVVREKEVREAWGLGRDKYQRAIRQLKELGLIADSYTRDEQGRYTSKHIDLIDPVEWMQMQSEVPSTESLKNRLSVNPKVGKTNHLVSKELLVNKESNNNLVPRARKAQEYPTWFDDLWSRYPARSGKNSKKEAYQSCNARLAEGYTQDDLADQLTKYSAYVKAKGDVGTPYVSMAKTFFGASFDAEAEWHFQDHQQLQTAKSLSTKPLTPYQQAEQSVREGAEELKALRERALNSKSAFGAQKKEVNFEF